MLSPWWTIPVNFFIALLLLSPSFNAQQRCARIGVRRAWSDLSVQRRTAYLNAVKSFIQKNRNGYSDFGDLHATRASQTPSIHWTYLFLPWHRYFLVEMERKLKTYDASVNIPYWDASRTPNTFADNDVFKADAFGSAGGITVACINNGYFAGLQLRNGQCVAKRGGKRPNERIVSTTAVMNNIIANAATFSQISQKLEEGYHGGVHIACGGHMETMQSPYDPLFYLHHCNIDRYYAIWQNRVGQLGLTDVIRVKGERQTLNTELKGYNGVKLENVMKTRDLCYVYVETATPAELRADSLVKPTLLRRSLSFRRRDYSAPENLAVSTEKSVLHVVEEGVLCLGEVALIAYPTELPESWIKLNNMDAKTVRKHEKWRRELIDKINHLSGYVRGSSVMYKKGFLQRILDSHTGIQRVTFYVRGKEVEVECEGGSAATRDRIIAAFEREMEVHPKPKKAMLVAIIGESVFNEKVSTINPFRSCA